MDEQKDQICPRCSGSGEGHTDKSRCIACNGSGVERQYGRMDPQDRLMAADVRRIGIKPSAHPLTPEQVEAAYAARNEARRERLAAMTPRRIEGAFDRPNVTAFGSRNWD